MALLSPQQNDATFNLSIWRQKRPVITQEFGENPKIYSRFGLKGHNGLDYRAKVGTPVFAPMDGIIRTKDSGSKGYGLHVKLRNEFKAAECVLGHFSSITVSNNQRVNMGDIIAYSGNTGFSTGPHVHFGYRLLKPTAEEDIFKWEVLNYKNGFAGYLDQIEYCLTWKGTHTTNSVK